MSMIFATSVYDGVGGRVEAFRFWLQDQLHDKGWTGSEFARRIGMSVATVNFWLTGHNLPGRAAIPKIARVLEANERDVLDLVLERPAPRYGDAVSRALNLPSDLTIEEAQYLHLAYKAFREWLELNPGIVAKAGREIA